MTIILPLLFVLFLILLGFSYFGYYLVAFYFGFSLVVILLVIFLFWLYEIPKVIFNGNAPYVRSNPKIIKRVLAEINLSAFSEKDKAIIYDLGCGDGRASRALSNNINVTVTGYEYFLLPYLFARLINIFSARKVRYKLQDFFKADLSAADIVFCYLFPDEMQRLEIKLKNELKPGAMVISNTFAFKNWLLEKYIVIDEKTPNKLSNKLYIYRK